MSTLGGEDGSILGTFVPGDVMAGKLIDVRGSNLAALTQGLVKRLKYSEDARQNP